MHALALNQKNCLHVTRRSVTYLEAWPVYIPTCMRAFYSNVFVVLSIERRERTYSYTFL